MNIKRAYAHHRCIWAIWMLLLSSSGLAATSAFVPSTPEFVVASLSKAAPKSSIDLSKKITAAQINQLSLWQINELNQRSAEQYKEFPNSIVAAQNRLLIADAVHDFQALSATLAHLQTLHSPRSRRYTQITLQRVNALIGLGQYEKISAECERLSSVATTWYTLCAEYGASLTEQSQVKVEAAYQTIKTLRTNTDEQRIWREEILADIALRLNQLPTAAEHCQKLLSIKNTLPNRLFCTDVTANSIRETSDTSVTGQLLNFLATKPRPEVQQRWRSALQEEELGARINTSLHLRELALFALDEGRTEDALHWAEQNWQSQKFPEDAYLLKRSAAAAQQAARFAGAHWQQQWPFDMRLPSKKPANP